MITPYDDPFVAEYTFFDDLSMLDTNPTFPTALSTSLIDVQFSLVAQRLITIYLELAVFYL
jgi:hypothetical protein